MRGSFCEDRKVGGKGKIGMSFGEFILLGVKKSASICDSKIALKEELALVVAFVVALE